MKAERYFSFSFPGEMDGSIDFLFVRSLLLGDLQKISKKKRALKFLV